MFKYATDRQYLVVPASRSAQAARIFRKLVGRKCDATIKHSKSRTLITIYN